MLSQTFSRFSSDAAKMAIQHMSIDKTISGIGRIILTASNKGGVGKSLVASNTAVALAEEGMNVGILDLNINAPSIPYFFNTMENNLQIVNKKFSPISAYGVETLSPGNGVEPDKALIWKNTFIPQLVNQLAKNVDWPDLDYLIVDSPTGTGDILMAINDALAIDGAILVTTPQSLSQQDVLRNIDAFSKLKIPILGLVKNFAAYKCPACFKSQHIFEGDGSVDVAKIAKLETLATIAADPLITESVERGFPLMHSAPNSVSASAFRQIAKRIIAKLPKKTEEQLAEEERIREEKRKEQEETIKKLQELEKQLLEEEKKKQEAEKASGKTEEKKA